MRSAVCIDVSHAGDHDARRAEPDRVAVSYGITVADPHRVTLAKSDGLTDADPLADTAAHVDHRGPRSVLRGGRRAHARP